MPCNQKLLDSIPSKLSYLKAPKINTYTHFALSTRFP